MLSSFYNVRVWKLCLILAVFFFTSSFATSPTSAHSNDSGNGSGSNSTSTNSTSSFSTVVLFGPYSSLAKKYLWQSLFEIWDDTLTSDLSTSQLQIVAASRDSADSGMSKVSSLIRSSVHCGIAGPSSDRSHCVRAKERFIANAVSYVSIKDSEGFKELGAALKRHEELRGYLGRVFYMAVASDLVPGIFKSLSLSGGIDFGSASRSKSLGIPYNRVVVEKPLGRDPAGSTLISKALNEIFGVTETTAPEDSPVMYIDHYLGKVGVTITAGFRQRLLALKDWAKVATGKSVALGEAVILEDEEVAGRTVFFNDYGAVRDVIQNHLFQMIVASQLPSDTEFNSTGRALTMKGFVAADVTLVDNETLVDDLLPPPPPPGMEPSSPLSKADKAAIEKLRIERFIDAVPSMLLLQYEGYNDHVLSDRNSSNWKFNKELLSICRPLIMKANAGGKKATLPPAECNPVVTMPISPYEHFGVDFRSVTGASMGLTYGKKKDGTPLQKGSTRFVVTAAKAAGIRTAYVRHFIAAQHSFCGPPSITYHIQGLIQLPAGVNSTNLPFELPHNLPCIIMTGVCNTVFDDPLEVLQPQSWPFDWDVYRAPDHGLFIAVPRLRPWVSTVARHLLVSDALGSTNAAQSSAWLAEELERETKAIDAINNPYVTRFVAPEHPEPIERSSVTQKKKRKDNSNKKKASDSSSSLGDDNNEATKEKGAALINSLKHLADSPGGHSSSAAYKGLISAALAGLTGRFVSQEENDLMWSVWGRTIEIADRAGAASDAVIKKKDVVPGSNYLPPGHSLPKIMSHTSGDRSWFFSLPPHSVDLIAADASGTAPGAGEDTTAAPTEVSVVRTNSGRISSTQFASDFISTMWALLTDRAYLHVVLDAGDILIPFYERLVAIDGRTISPWQASFLWPARERDLTKDGEKSTMGFLITHLVKRTPLISRPGSIIGPFNPNVTHTNILAERVTFENAHDIIVLAFPLPPAAASQGEVFKKLRKQVVDSAAGRPRNEESDSFKALYGTAHPATLGRSSDFYVSSGLGMKAALEDIADAKSDEDFIWPVNPKIDQDLMKHMPAGMPKEKADPFSGMPAPPLYFNGTMDVRLSMRALRSARACFVVVPRSSIYAYAVNEQSNEADITTEGESVLSEAVKTAWRFDDESAPLPSLFLEDLGKLIGGRKNVRIYIADL